MEPRPVPFNRPTTASRALDYVGEALAGGHLAGDGPFTDRCRQLLEERLDGARVLLTPSCTHALEMTALLLEVGPGDEVLMPSFTFVSTANAYVLRGATPVFVDIDPATGNLDPDDLARKVTPASRAVVVVHYAGIACDMARIGAVAERHGLVVVEDNAHGLFGTWRSRPLGALGAMATLSFHETKNVTCGEGGALVLSDPALVSRAEIIREKGTNRSQFIRGEVNRYAWMDVGSSYLLSDVLAGVLASQLEEADAIQESRRRTWCHYAEALAPWAASCGVILPTVPDDCGPAWHSFHLLLPDRAARDRCIGHLRDRGIGAPFHYLPLHLSDMGRRLGGHEGDCPVTEDFSARLLRLPLHHSLLDDEVDAVVAGVRAFRP
ncbi:MAG: dTDP-4-amino-4,6-dideoxygalactose transaminase [Acidimicrobiales bacterium]|nr:dTDP-4-amino-4,6-dideoxygalactose transaminase [Acidimicrobiales bacterium]MCB9371424.1 dTDP-4-amino-4,6-dideoxygalactose transaminase [Microthrixaceae bacterium]